MFDWTCVQRMETLAGSEDLVWKAAKPVLQVYVPLKACDASGQVRERVHSAKVDQGCESSEKALGREADRADRHKQNILTGLRDKLFDELSLPCFFYVARSLHSTPADRFSPHLWLEVHLSSGYDCRISMWKAFRKVWSWSLYLSSLWLNQESSVPSVFEDEQRQLIDWSAKRRAVSSVTNCVEAKHRMHGMNMDEGGTEEGSTLMPPSTLHCQIQAPLS